MTEITKPEETQPDISLDDIDSKEEAQDAARRLRGAIRYHDHRYYVLDDPVISDDEYDELFHTLEQIEDEHDLDTAGSPTQQVGGEPLDELETVEHPVPMLSLKAVLEEDAVERFLDTCRDTLGRDDVEFTAEPKYDGAAVELDYLEGRLDVAATRGDGETGENVTENVKTMGQVPLELREAEGLPVPDRLVVRGEIYMPKDELEELNERLAQANEKTFANPRNAAAGTLRQLDPKVAAERPLRIFCYEVAQVEGHDFETEREVIETLPRWGLPTSQEEVRIVSSLEEMKRYHQEMADRREDLPYEIDGVVFKVDRREDHEALGVRSSDPRWALAYKLEPRRATTEIEDVEIQVGRTGSLTPVAHLEPVEIGGAEVQRASLHNPRELDRLGVKIGDTVLVERAGDVIPQVVKVIEDERDGSEKDVSMPDECPECGTEAVISEDRKHARCPNLDCPAQLRDRIQHFCSREGLDIEGLGEERSAQLVDEGLVESLGDLFELSQDDLLDLEGYGEKSAENLLEEIEGALEQPLDQFLYALGIPHVGGATSRILARHFETLDNLLEASESDLAEIGEIGPTMAEEIVAFLSEERNRKMIDRIRDAGLELENPLYGQGEGALEGLTFVFTGSLDRWTRDEAQELVERHGARATSSVSGETDYVVAGPGSGQKKEDAEEEDVPILDEHDFVELLEDRGVSVS